MLAASALSSTSTQSDMVNEVHAYVSADQDNHPIAMNFHPTDGGAQSDTGGSPAVGSMFALLAMRKSSLSVSVYSFPKIYLL